MPLQSSVSALIGNRKRGLAISGLISKMQSDDPKGYQAVRSIESAVNDIYSAISDSPTVEQLTVVDANGSVLAQIGDFFFGGVSYSGAAFSQVWIGPNANPLTAPFFSDGQHVVIGKNGVVEVHDLAGNTGATLGVTSDAPLAITAATNASPSVLTIAGNTFINGDTLVIGGSLGNTAINGYRIVKNVGTAGAGTFTLTDGAGTAINGNGVYAGSGTATRYYAGILAQTFAIGPDFANYKLRAFADGSLQIQNASFVSNVSGITTTVGNETIGGAGVIGVEIQDNATGDALALTSTFMALYNTDPANLKTAIAAARNGAAGILRVFDGSGAGGISGGGEQIILDGSNGNTQARGTVQSTGGFVAGTSAGIGTSRKMVASVATSASGVFGTPAAGQSNGTVVTGVTLVTSGFSGGILTS